MSTTPPHNQTTLSLPPIDAYGDGGFRIDGTRHDGAVLMLDDQVEAWGVDGLDALSIADFATFLERDDKPDMVIFGVGPKMRHPNPEIREAFIQAGIGLEVLDSATACRVYNMLAGEARRIYLPTPEEQESSPGP